MKDLDADLTLPERDHFMRIPSEYFSAVSRRNPCPVPAATESVIFEGYDVFSSCTAVFEI